MNAQHHSKWCHLTDTIIKVDTIHRVESFPGGYEIDHDTINIGYHNINEDGDFVDSSLYLAMAFGRLNIMKKLIDNGWDVNYGEVLPLSIAVGSYCMLQDSLSLEIVKLLLKNGANVNGVEMNSCVSPLFIAVERNDTLMVNLLIKAGACVSVKNFVGSTPLFAECNNKSADIAYILIKNGANINERDYDNRTPLFEAVWNVNFEIVSFLLQNGADVNAKSSHWTVLDMPNREEIKELLCGYGAKHGYEIP